MSSFDFVEENFIIGQKNPDIKPSLVFFRKGFRIGGSKVTPDYRDTILHGNTALTLVNSKANGLNYLKLFGATEQRNLPSGYTELTHLQGDGTAYIQTPIEPTDTTGMKIVFEYGSAGGSGAICGTFNGVSPRKDTFFVSTNSGTVDNTWAFIAQAGSTLPSGNSEAPVVGETYTALINYKNSRTFGFEGFTQQSVGSNGVLSNKVLLFARLNINNNNITASNCKIKYVEFTEGSATTHIYIPARFNNTLGLYDKITGNFLTNAGTGTFTAGADVTPSPYNPVDIVCNNGVVKYGALGKNLYNPATRIDGYYIGADGVIAQGSGSFCYSDLIPVKPNTTYVLSGIAGQSDIRRLHAYDSNGDWISQISFANTNVERIYNITGTTPNNCVYVRISIPMADRNVQIEQGSTATAYEPYQAGIYTDGTTETVEITGKNLFDVDNNLLTGYYIESTTGHLMRSSDGSSSCFKDFLPSKPNITYTMSRLSAGIGTALRMWAYDKDKNPISLVFNSASGASKVTGTTPNDTAYIRCSFGSIPQYSQNVQLELGSTATTYEPYFNGGSATAEMLLKVGDYQDIQSVLDGGVTRNVGIKVFDGTENWETSGPNALIRRASVTWGVVAGLGGFCTHLTVLKSGETTFAGSCRFATDFNIYEYQIAFGVHDIAQFKQYLADQYNTGTPVIIVYPLATPTTETVTGQPLTIQEGTNIVQITQASMDNLELEVSYKAGVAVTIAEVQNAQLDDNVEVTINGE